MLKSELLEKLKDIKDDADVDSAILNLGFAKPIDSIDSFKELLANNDKVNGYWTSEKDRAVSQGIETFKGKSLPKLIEEELKKKSNAGLTPEQIQLKEMQKQLDEMKAEKTRVEMSNKYSKVLNEKGLSADLVDFVLGTDDDSTIANIEKINNIISTVVNNQVKTKLNQGGEQVPPIQTNTIGRISWDEVLKNPDLFEQYKSQEKQADQQ